MCAIKSGQTITSAIGQAFADFVEACGNRPILNDFIVPDISDLKIKSQQEVTVTIRVCW